MICTNENDILFDDVEALENILGKNSLKVSSVNANCDCTSYTPTFDEDFDTQESAATAAANS
ncbi:hypothetical protein [Dyadobacter bucti]|uniref:hypothetical protein n=1 Tax=Dyadobacter bucti TaxID=2572203 RepID=UPI0011093868|nr:hypothetical protein [Dyadobacter bucti]